VVCDALVVCAGASWLVWRRRAACFGAVVGRASGRVGERWEW
jgi:hypothetical protein